MRPMRRHVVAAALLLAGIGLSSATPGTAASADVSIERLPGAMVVDALPGVTLTVDEVLPPDEATPAGAALQLAPADPLTTSAGSFLVCHDAGVPADVIADVVTALVQWSAALDITGPTIAVDFVWTPLSGSGSLGVAGPTEFLVDARLPLADTGYPLALANELLDTDHNGPGCGDDHSEMALYLNSTAGGDGSLWNIGDDTANDAQVDLSTVVLHEVGHGLGIVSSAQLVNDVVQWPRTNSPRYVYDAFFAECITESAAGCDDELVPITSSESNRLRGARLWFRTLGIEPLELHAPTEWSGGSSVSHLDELRYSVTSGFGLMTPYLRRGESFDAIDPALQSLVQTMGWSLAATPTAPTAVEAEAGNGRIDVSFERPALGVGAPATGYRVTVTSGSKQIAHARRRTAASLTITGLANGTSHRVSVAAVNSAGASGASAGAERSSDPTRIAPVRERRVAPPSRWFETSSASSRPDKRSPRPRRRLRNGETLGSEASRIAGDARLERRLQVVRLYLGFFERDPDPAGLRYWFDEVGRGVSLDVVASSFAIASEFERGEVVPAGEFIDAAYGRILDRAPDEPGRRYWLAQLDRGLDRGQMLILFSESAEHVAKTRVEANTIVVGFGLLGRALTAAERTEFAAVVKTSGAPGLAAAVADGAAYDERHNPR